MACMVVYGHQLLQFDEVVSEKNMFLFSSGKLYNCHCDFLLAHEESERLDVFDEVVFYKQAFMETFHLDRSSIFYLMKFGILA
jgi:hypothetical protein